MFEMIKKIWRVGTVTERQPFRDAPLKYRGRIEIKHVAGTNWQACAAACPTGALTVETDRVKLFHGACIFCGRCAEVCNTEAVHQTTDGNLAAFDKKDLVCYAYLNAEKAGGKRDE